MSEQGAHEAKLAKSGYLVAIGLAVHNFPEGMAVFLSGVSDLQLGIALAIAIGIHNIPEGVAVTMPIYYATKSRRKPCHGPLWQACLSPWALWPRYGYLMIFSQSHWWLIYSHLLQVLWFLSVLMSFFLTLTNQSIITMLLVVC